MSWDYAELSKLAKEAGGPERFVEALSEASKAEGRAEMEPWIVAALAGGTGLGVGLCIGVTKAINYFKKKRKESRDAVEAAKEKLISEIKEYDATHTDVEKSSSLSALKGEIT